MTYLNTGVLVDKLLNRNVNKTLTKEEFYSYLLEEMEEYIISYNYGIRIHESGYKSTTSSLEGKIYISFGGVFPYTINFRIFNATVTKDEELFMESYMETVIEEISEAKEDVKFQLDSFIEGYGGEHDIHWNETLAKKVRKKNLKDIKNYVDTLDSINVYDYSLELHPDNPIKSTVILNVVYDDMFVDSLSFNVKTDYMNEKEAIKSNLENKPYTGIRKQIIEEIENTINRVSNLQEEIKDIAIKKNYYSFEHLPDDARENVVPMKNIINKIKNYLKGTYSIDTILSVVDLNHFSRESFVNLLLHLTYEGKYAGNLSINVDSELMNTDNTLTEEVKDHIYHTLKKSDQAQLVLPEHIFEV